MAERHGFPLPTSSYKELVKIIQGYGRVEVDASLSDVAQSTAIGETIISGNNKFLLAAGIIQGGKRKSVTTIGGELAIALQHDLPDEIAAKWRTIVESTDFLQKVVAAVRIRKGMDEANLQTHVAYSAGQPKTPAVSTGASTIVDILKNAGLLKEEAGNLVAATPPPKSIPETVELSLSLADRMSDAPAKASSPQIELHVGRVQLAIDVTVQCTADDLDGLGRKLRKLIQELNASDDSQGNEASASADDDRQI